MVVILRFLIVGCLFGRVWKYGVCNWLEQLLREGVLSNFLFLLFLVINNMMIGVCLQLLEEHMGRCVHDLKLIAEREMMHLILDTFMSWWVILLILKLWQSIVFITFIQVIYSLKERLRVPALQVIWDNELRRIVVEDRVGVWLFHVAQYLLMASYYRHYLLGAIALSLFRVYILDKTRSIVILSTIISVRGSAHIVELWTLHLIKFSRSIVKLLLCLLVLNDLKLQILLSPL